MEGLWGRATKGGFGGRPRFVGSLTPPAPVAAPLGGSGNRGDVKSSERYQFLLQAQTILSSVAAIFFNCPIRCRTAAAVVHPLLNHYNVIWHLPSLGVVKKGAIRSIWQICWRCSEHDIRPFCVIFALLETFCRVTYRVVRASPIGRVDIRSLSVID